MTTIVHLLLARKNIATLRQQPHSKQHNSNHVSNCSNKIAAMEETKARSDGIQLLLPGGEDTNTGGIRAEAGGGRGSYEVVVVTQTRLRFYVY